MNDSYWTFSLPRRKRHSLRLEQSPLTGRDWIAMWITRRVAQSRFQIIELCFGKRVFASLRFAVNFSQRHPRFVGEIALP